MENKEKVAKIKRESWLRNKHKYLERENARREKYRQNNIKYYREIDLIRRDNLTDSYVRKLIKNRSNLLKEDISNDLIECMRALQKIKRILKEKSKEHELNIKDSTNGKD